MTVQIDNQAVTIEGIGSIAVTAPVQDPTNANLWVRTIQLYTPPDINGNTTLLYTLKVYAATVQSQIELTAPAVTF